MLAFELSAHSTTPWAAEDIDGPKLHSSHGGRASHELLRGAAELSRRSREMGWPGIPRSEPEQMTA